MAGGGHKEGGECGRKMSVHDVCTLYTGGCLRSISSVSPWYSLVDIPIGVHSPHSARLGHPSRLKIGTYKVKYINIITKSSFLRALAVPEFDFPLVTSSLPKYMYCGATDRYDVVKS